MAFIAKLLLMFCFAQLNWHAGMGTDDQILEGSNYQRLQQIINDDMIRQSSGVDASVNQARQTDHAKTTDLIASNQTFLQETKPTNVETSGSSNYQLLQNMINPPIMNSDPGAPPVSVNQNHGKDHDENHIIQPVSATAVVESNIQGQEQVANEHILMDLLHMPGDPEQLEDSRKNTASVLPKLKAVFTRFLQIFGPHAVLKSVRTAISTTGSSPQLDNVLSKAEELAAEIDHKEPTFQMPALPFVRDLDAAAIRTSFYYSTSKDNVIACGLPDSCPVHGHPTWKKESYTNFNWDLCTHLFVPTLVSEEKDAKIEVSEHFASLIAEARQRSKDLKVIISLSFSKQIEKTLIENKNQGKEKAYVQKWVKWLSQNELLGKKEPSKASKNTTIPLSGFQIPLFSKHVGKEADVVFDSLFKAFHKELHFIKEDYKELKKDTRKNFQLFAKILHTNNFEKTDPTMEILADIVDYFYLDSTRMYPYSYEHNDLNLISIVEKVKRMLKKDENKLVAKKIVLGLPLKAMELKEKLETDKNPPTAEDLLLKLQSLDTKPLTEMVKSKDGHEKSIHFAEYNKLNTQEYHPHLKMDLTNKLIFLGNSKEELEKKIHFIILRGLGGAFLNLEHANDPKFFTFHEGFLEITAILNKRFFGKVLDRSSLNLKVQEPNDWISDKDESTACFLAYSAPEKNKECKIFTVKVTNYPMEKKSSVLGKLVTYLPQKRQMNLAEKKKTGRGIFGKKNATSCQI